MTVKGWTPERERRLMEMVADGVTYEAIERAFAGSGLSRSACIGKARRLREKLGMPQPGRCEAARRSAKPKRRLKAVTKPRPKPAPPVVVPAEAPEPDPVAPEPVAVAEPPDPIAVLDEDDPRGPADHLSGITCRQLRDPRLEAGLRGDCKFPITDDDVPKDGHRFCGAPRAPGQVYCEAHCTAAYNGKPPSGPSEGQVAWALKNAPTDASARKRLRQWGIAA